MDESSLTARLRSLLQTEEGIVSAHLFGSRAEEREHRESDLDVGLLLDRSRYGTAAARFTARVRLSALLGAKTGLAVDVVVLNDAPPGLARRIVTRGKPIMVRDPEADRAFSRDAQLRAADLEPFLRRMRRTKLAALARP
jgi:predicted nucleotidyltransferase